MKINLTLFLLIITIGSANIHSQTIGLHYNTAESYNGYTLFAPLYGKTTYLIDNCGEMINSWKSDYNPGASVYMTETGLIARAGNVINKSFPGGGSGGIIEFIDWDGNVVWDYILSDDEHSFHHDFEIMPNGNILALVWKAYSKEEALALGRLISPDVLWSEKIIEIMPNFENGTGEIIWEWDIWDHLVQNVDPNKDKYGDITNPGLINLNYSTRGFMDSDWLHFNSIDYNPELDQIVISNHNFSELWVIDHSTTTEEARTNKGGKYGKGGNILYRWGNPQAYGHGTNEDQKLFLQDDPHWIGQGLKDEGRIMIFNNQAGTPEGKEYSSVIIIEPPMDDNNNYIYNNGKAFGPEKALWKYEDEPKTDFYSMAVSGAQRLSNGNTLICAGWVGSAFEIDENKNKVWKYVNPINIDGKIGEQGQILNFNQIFRAERFSPDFAGFAGKDLTPKGYIETGSEFTCQIFDGGTNSVRIIDNSNIKLHIIDNSLHLESPNIISSVSIYSIGGMLLAEQWNNSRNLQADLNKLNNGVYIGIVEEQNGQLTQFKFLID